MLLSRSIAAGVRRATSRVAVPSSMIPLSTQAGKFQEKLEFDLHDPMIEIRWASARCGVLGGEVLLLNLDSEDLAVRAKAAGPMKQVRSCCDDRRLTNKRCTYLLIVLVG
jgi:hypothetical protein